MKMKLKIFTQDSNDMGKCYRFAVIDTQKSRKYPQNFLCIFPVAINKKSTNSFSKMFGNKSKEQAELLLIEALKEESEREVKAEIRRRLALLNPKKYV